MPMNFLNLGLIHAVFPRARIIHMQRHPIDTCLSIYFQHFADQHPYAHDLEDLAHYYGEYARLMQHWRRCLPAASLFELPYEALVGDQAAWTRRLLEFLDLPWDPQCLEFHRTERVVITTSKWQVRQKLHGASAGRWRHYEPWAAESARPLTVAGEVYGAAVPAAIAVTATRGALADVRALRATAWKNIAEPITSSEPKMLVP